MATVLLPRLAARAVPGRRATARGRRRRRSTRCSSRSDARRPGHARPTRRARPAAAPAHQRVRRRRAGRPGDAGRRPARRSTSSRRSRRLRSDRAVLPASPADPLLRGRSGSSSVDEVWDSGATIVLAVTTSRVRQAGGEPVTSGACTTSRRTRSSRTGMPDAYAGARPIGGPRLSADSRPAASAASRAGRTPRSARRRRRRRCAPARPRWRRLRRRPRASRGRPRRSSVARVGGDDRLACSAARPSSGPGRDAGQLAPRPRPRPGPSAAVRAASVADGAGA